MALLLTHVSFHAIQPVGMHRYLGAHKSINIICILIYLINNLLIR